MNIISTLLWMMIGSGFIASTAPASDSLSQAVDATGGNLLARTVAAAPSENLVLSPLSIHEAMMMVTLGAVGETRDQLDRILNVQHLKQIQSAAGLLGQAGQTDPGAATTTPSTDVSTGRRAKESPAFLMSNRLWLQQGFAIEPAYQKRLADDWHASVTPLDFIHDLAAATADINTAVSHDTRDKIPHLLEPGALTPDVRLVLTNAIYFKGGWENTFQSSSTADAPFHAVGKDVTAKTMRQVSFLNYAQNDQQQTVELPYAGGDFSMLIVLPKIAGDKAAAPDWSMPRAPRRVELFLPRFKFQSQLELAQELQAMGATLAFTNQADFSGITRSAPLKIGAVIHQARIDVNEDGTEAAAATAVVMRVGAIRREQEPVTMKVDRPFYFAIRHNPSGLLLFLGHVADPTK